MIALLTNDDGIDAEGLASLRAVASRFFDEIWVVAPREQQSQIGHRVTTDTPIGYESRGERCYAIAGTPADCVRVAWSTLLPVRPDWVLSGINHGGNLGRHDLSISGTVAAVREAALAGIPAIAFSHYLLRGHRVDWAAAAGRAGRVLAALLEEPPGEGHFWNVNLPHLVAGESEPQAVHCEPERQPLQVRYEKHEAGQLVYTGDYHERPRIDGSDVAVCFGGDIAVSRVPV